MGKPTFIDSYGVVYEECGGFPKTDWKQNRVTTDVEFYIMLYIQ